MHALLRLTFALSLFAPLAAHAADAPKPAPVSPPPPAVTLTLQEWQAIGTSLNRSDVISAREAADLIAKISAQLNPPQPAPAKK